MIKIDYTKEHEIGEASTKESLVITIHRDDIDLLEEIVAEFLSWDEDDES